MYCLNTLDKSEVDIPRTQPHKPQNSPIITSRNSNLPKADCTKWAFIATDFPNRNVSRFPPHDMRNTTCVGQTRDAFPFVDTRDDLLSEKTTTRLEDAIYVVSAWYLGLSAARMSRMSRTFRQEPQLFGPVMND